MRGVGPEIFRLNFEIELKHWWFRARREILRKLIAQVAPPSPDTLLVDIGCGTGANIGALAEDYACVGMDLSPQAIRLARSRFHAVRFLCGTSPEDLGSVLQKARLFLFNDVLEHVADDRGLLAPFIEAAAPGTWFLITVPADRTLWSPHDEHHGHYRRYDKRELEMLWRGLPVAPALVSYFNSRMYPLVKVARTINRRLGRTSGDAGTDLRIPHARVNRFLERVFAGEADVLAGVLRGVRPAGYRFGVSLVAMLRKLPVAAASAAIPRFDVSAAAGFVPCGAPE